MVEPQVFIFLGSDELQKQKKIETIQKKIFPPGLRDLNYTLLYGDDKSLKASDLKIILSSTPTEGAKMRLVFIRQAHKLKKTNLCVLSAVLKDSGQSSVIVLDIDEVQGTESFVNEFLKLGAQLCRFKSDVPVNVFDLGRAIVRHKPEDALMLLNDLFKSRLAVEKIIGAIFWQWEYARSKGGLKDETYKKGLKLLLESDKKLKSSSSSYGRRNLILETLVVKLSYLT